MKEMTRNPFLNGYDTPRQTTPFHLIGMDDFEPAIREGMRQEDEEIKAITENPDAPTFGNTVLALEQAGVPTASVPSAKVGSILILLPLS